MTVISTLNASREQIERDLSKAWSEPGANVYAILRELRAGGRLAQATVTPATATAAVPGPAKLDGDSVAALTAAAARCSSKRIQALGARLDLLVEDLVTKLTEQAERFEQEAAERRAHEANLAAVRRLEEQLREAKAKLGRARTPDSPSRSKAGAKGGTTSAAAYDGGPPPSVIRAWCREHGVDCSTHGKLNRSAIDAYRQAVAG